MKIIIAGDGKIGFSLTKQLAAEGHDLTVIDINPKVLDTVQNNFDIMVVCGNCATMDTLQAANIEQADLLIAVSDKDEINLLCCMTAHSINPNLHSIARVRDPEYTNQAYLMCDLMGLSMVVNPERSAAQEISRLLKYPGFLKRDTFVGGRVEIVELKVSAKSPMNGVKIMKLSGVIGCKVLICAIVRAGKCIIPSGMDSLMEGDRVFLTAPSNVLQTLLKNLGAVTKKVRSCLIIGGGRISYYLARNLVSAGIRVKIIEQNHDKCVSLASLLPGVTVVEGDASTQSMLSSEGMELFDSVVSLTGLDELNAMLAMYCSGSVSNIVTKIDRIESTGVLDVLPLGSVIHPKELASNEIVRYVRAMQNQSGAAVTVHSIADSMAEASEFAVTAATRNLGVPLKDIRLKDHVLVACIAHGPTVEIPDGDSVISEGDTVIVVTDGSRVIGQLNDIFE